MALRGATAGATTLPIGKPLKGDAMQEVFMAEGSISPLR